MKLQICWVLTFCTTCVCVFFFSCPCVSRVLCFPVKMVIFVILYHSLFFLWLMISTRNCDLKFPGIILFLW